MLRCLLIHRIDKSKSAVRVLSLELLGFHPNRKEFSSQVPRLRLREIEIALIACWRIRHVEVIVEQALCGVGVSVYDQHRVVKLFCALRFDRLLCRLKLGHKWRNGQEAYHRTQHDPWQHRRKSVLDRRLKAAEGGLLGILHE